MSNVHTQLNERNRLFRQSSARILSEITADGDEVEEEAKQPWDAGLNAMRQSLEFARKGQPEEALRVLDDSIAQANEEKRGMWVGTLCRHASVLANAMGDIRREIQYAEQALPHADNERFALYNFAQLLLRGGDAARAERYAKKAHQLALAQGTEADRDLIAALRKQWPNLSHST